MSDAQDLYGALRKKAEEVLAGQQPEATETDPEVREVVHELLVHQVELQMQNEELRRAQEEIDRARNKYADLYDFAPVGYLSFDRAGLILEANLTGAELLHVDRASLIRQPFSVFVARPSQKTFYAHLNGIGRDGRKGACELTLKRLDGTRIEVRLESAPAVERDGTVAIRTAISDITEGKRAEDERTRLAVAVEQAAEGIYMVDPHGVIEYTNDAFRTIFGYGREELTGKDIRVMRDDRDNSSHESLWSDIQAGKRWSGRLSETRKDGAGLQLEATVVPIKDSSGNIIAHVGVCRDVTEQLKLENQLRQAQKMEALGTFAGGIEPSTPVPGGRERILFIDDEEALVEVGTAILAKLGYEVTSRTSSREALALLKEDPSRFDLVITDQTMPGMTGAELAKEVLALRPDMPLIMCTGFNQLVDADKATTAGIKAFVMKPLTKREIAKTIRKVLDA